MKRLRYVCKCIPQFNGTIQQIKAAAGGNFAHCEIRQQTRTDDVLKSKLREITFLFHSRYVNISTDIDFLITNDIPKK